MKIRHILSVITRKLTCHVLGVHDLDIKPLDCSMFYTGLIEIPDIQYCICRNCGGYFRITARPVEQAFSYGIKFTTKQITEREFQDATTLLKL